MRKRTRGQLLARVKRYQQAAPSDTSQDVSMRQFIEDGTGRVYSFLGASNAGFLQTRRIFTMTVETALVVLPANFDTLIAMRLQVGGIHRTLSYESEVQAARYSDELQSNAQRNQRWQIEGPGVDYENLTDSYVSYDQRLRFTPPLTASSELRVSYVTQPPSLADVDGGGASLHTYTDVAQDATIVVDVISEPIEEALVGYARVWGAPRGDATDRTSATQQLAEVTADYLRSRAKRQSFQADTLDRYSAQQGIGGY